MWSTPARLFVVLDGTLKAFDSMRNQAGQSLNTSDASVTPRKVQVMRTIRDEIVRKYM